MCNMPCVHKVMKIKKNLFEKGVVMLLSPCHVAGGLQ